MQDQATNDAHHSSKRRVGQPRTSETERLLAELREANQQLVEAGLWDKALAGAATAVARELSLRGVVEAAVEQTLTVLGGLMASLFLADEERRELRLAGQRNIPASIVGRLARVSFDAPFVAARAASERQLQLIEDTAALDPSLTLSQEIGAQVGTRSIVSAPLLAFGRLVGVLSYGLPRPHRFSTRELSAITSIADLFAVGIANAQAYEREERLRGEMEAVHEAALAIAGEPNLHAVLQTIVDQARLVANAEYAALGIGADPARRFDPWVFSGLPAELATAMGEFPRPVGTLGLVARGGQAIRVPNVRAHPAFAGFPPQHPVMVSFLGVPVHYHGRSVGNLYLANKVAAEEFTAEDQRGIEILAAHAGIAIEQARLRRAVDLEHARVQAVLASSPQGIAFVEAGTGRLIANPAACEIFGGAKAPEVGLRQYLGQICTPEGRQLPWEELPPVRALRGETTSNQELLVRRLDGAQVPILTSAAPVRTATGTQLGAVAVFQDITALKELERLREEWTSVIVHDLRQPVTIIGASVGVLRRFAERQADPQTRKIVEHVRTATANLARMIADLLDASRIEARRLTLERQTLDLGKLVREVVEREAAVSRRPPVRIAVAGPIPLVSADPSRVEQVLGNLLSNAAKYGYPESEIVVELAPRPGAVLVSVTNRGPGVSPADLPKLFSRFHRTAEARAERVPGLGLGLYISRGLVEAHGGQIWAESTPGETTTFHFTLPTSE